VALSRSPGSKTRDWALGKQVETCDKVRWGISSFNACKFPEENGIFPDVIQEDIPVITDPVVKIFRAFIAFGYVLLS
jgi:hypothetical protein